MLQPALNLGLLEKDFWDMTKAEIERYMEGAVWRMKTKAQFDYMLADLFGVSAMRILDSNVNFPTVEQAYPFLFEDKEIQKKSEEEVRMENSLNRFMDFALKHNAKLRDGVKDN